MKSFFCMTVLLAQSTTWAFTPLHHQTRTLSTSTALFASSKKNQDKKDSDRARYENNLEKMMDRDWREFRAKLVAQEQAEEEIKQQTQLERLESSSRPHHNNHHQPMHSNRRLVPRPHAPHNGHHHQHGRHAAHPNQQHHHRRHHYNQKQANIFNGKVSIGAAELSDETTALALSEDPFLSPSELALFQVKTPSINKHRWAHEIPHVETGAVLIANEKLGGVFHQTVVLIVRHCEQRGTVGIVINRPMDGNLRKIASETESNLDESTKRAFSNAVVSYGGPVWEGDFSVIHGFGQVEGSTKVCPGVFIGGSLELQDQVRKQSFDPAREALFCRGHAAWLPGQLEEEIQMGVWYTAAASSDLILRHAGAPVTADDRFPTDLWAEILSTMGGKHEQVVQQLHFPTAAHVAAAQHQEQSRRQQGNNNDDGNNNYGRLHP